ncbi:MAG: hypothetical protein HC898_08805, partial [Phycisphaerales bacterium]|nr:hypothetical protein [Phycisphaerales bacterium]
MKNLLIGVGMTVLATAGAAEASPDFVKMDYKGVVPSGADYGKVYYRLPDTTTHSTGDIYGAFLKWERSNVAGADNNYAGDGIPLVSAANRIFYTLCIELVQQAQTGSYEVKEVDEAQLGGTININATQAEQITKLWGYYGTDASFKTNAQKAAGLQIAIWEIVYDYTNDFLTGSDYSVRYANSLNAGNNITFGTAWDAASIANAQSYLDFLPSILVDTASTLSLVSASRQDQSFLVDGSAAIVPCLLRL